MICYVVTCCFSLHSAPGPQELHRVHREAWCGGRHLPPLWNCLKYPEIAVGDAHCLFITVFDSTVYQNVHSVQPSSTEMSFVIGEVHISPILALI